MGLPVPEHMDGKVLGQLFETPLEASIQAWSQVEAADADEGYSPQDEEALRERLEGLGYL